MELLLVSNVIYVKKSNQAMRNGKFHFDSRFPKHLFRSKASGLVGCDIGFVVAENVELAVEPKWHKLLYGLAVITVISSTAACK